MSGMDIRSVGPADAPFLAEAILLAAFPPGPLPDGAAEMPHARRWTDAWGREGDAGVVAWRDGRRVGAAWCRVFPDAMALGPDGRALPELAIAVIPEDRSAGVGAALLDALAREAAADGHAALCLGVSVRNPAHRLYVRKGFTEVRRDGERVVMVRPVAPSGDAA
jgi:GNAT superfamily N-acetyltransferase